MRSNKRSGRRWGSICHQREQHASATDSSKKKSIIICTMMVILEVIDVAYNNLIIQLYWEIWYLLNRLRFAWGSCHNLFNTGPSFSFPVTHCYIKPYMFLYCATSTFTFPMICHMNNNQALDHSHKVPGSTGSRNGVEGRGSSLYKIMVRRGYTSMER